MLLNGQIVTIDYSELLNLRKEINKIGQNINQLTKYANTFNELDKELLLGLADEIDKMKKLVKEEFENKEVRKIKMVVTKVFQIKQPGNLKNAINYIVNDAKP